MVYRTEKWWFSMAMLNNQMVYIYNNIILYNIHVIIYHICIYQSSIYSWMGEHLTALKTSRLLHQGHPYIWGNPPTRKWVTRHLWLMSSINMSWTAILIWVNSIELMDLIATDQTIDTSIGLHKHAGVVCSYCSFQSPPHHHITLVIQTEPYHGRLASARQ